MKKHLTLAAAALIAALSLTCIMKFTAHATSLTGITVGNPTAQSASPTVTNLTVTGTITAAAIITTGNTLGAAPSAQTLAAAFQINADACGGVKLISSAGVVTSSTTTPLPAAAAGNAGCAMDVVNVGASPITIKLVAGSYNWAGAADVVLGSSDTFRIVSSGSQWYQVGGTGNN